MRKSIIFIFTCFIPYLASSQAENFELGKKAYESNQYIQAIKHLTIAVNEEKYEMKGKDLPLAYSYLASIKLSFLASKLDINDVANIKQNYGNLTSIYSDLENAINFQSKATAALNSNTKGSLEKFIIQSSKALATPLIDMNKSEYSAEEAYHAELISEFLSYFESKPTNEVSGAIWDLLGLSQFVLGKNQEGIITLNRARETYIQSDDFNENLTHLKNHILSNNYYFKDAPDPEKARAICKSGIELVKTIANSLDDDDFNVIKKYTIVENKFYYTISKLDE